MPLREVTLTLPELSLRFDQHYDDGFSWSSERGGKAFSLLKAKQLFFIRHTETEYQLARDENEWSDVRHLEHLRDTPLTHKGVLQAAHMGSELTAARVRPDLIVSSPLTRCLHTASLTFPDVFLGLREDCNVKLCSLLPEKVDSYSDCGRNIADILADRPELSLFENSMTRSRFQKHNQDSNLDQAFSPRWKLTSDDKNGIPFPRESKNSARKRVALFWRWLSENRPEEVIAVFTHSKLVKQQYDICLLGDNVAEFHNGDCIHVVLDDA